MPADIKQNRSKNKLICLGGAIVLAVLIGRGALVAADDAQPGTQPTTRHFTPNPDTIIEVGPDGTTVVPRPGHIAPGRILPASQPQNGGSLHPPASSDIHPAAPAAPATSPSTQAASQAKVTPEARPLLDAVGAAYQSLSSLQMAGVYSAKFVTDDQTVVHALNFTAFYQSPNLFRHEMKGDVLLGAGANKAYIFQPNQNVYFEQNLSTSPASAGGLMKEDKTQSSSSDDHSPSTTAPATEQANAPATSPATAPAPLARLTLEKLPSQVSDLIKNQNPSLELALSIDPVKELLDGALEVSREPDAPLPAIENPAATQGAHQNSQAAAPADTTRYPVLKIAAKGQTCRLFIDPQSHLLRCVEWDITGDLQKRGASDLHSAVLQVNYTFCAATFAAAGTSETPSAPARWGVGPAAMPTSADWTPPATARQAKTAMEANDADPEEVAKALVGKPAPDLQLTGLDGKPFHLAEHKGSVVVLDLFATWCGPCVGELPSLDRLFRQKKEGGLQMFLIDQGEAADVVRKFVAQKQLTPPVILDDQHQSQQRYGAQAIPETIVIGKDGIIRKVFIGASPDSEQQLQQAVDEALQAK